MADSPVDTALAEAFRDWIHESPLSLCGYGSDECPDWPMAYELARIAASVPARSPDAITLDGWQEFRCAHSHRWRSEDKPTRGPVCNTSTFARSTGGGGEQG